MIEPMTEPTIRTHCRTDNQVLADSAGCFCLEEEEPF
jgi:hypothetical protein